MELENKIDKVMELLQTIEKRLAVIEKQTRPVDFADLAKESLKHCRFED